MGFLSFILLTIVENNQQTSQIYYLVKSDNFKEVLASTEEEEEEDEEEEEEESDEDSVEQKNCNKLFESETCEKMKQNIPIVKEELTEEEIKEKAIINRYLEPIETEKKPTIDNSMNTETEISNITNDNNIKSSSTMLSNEIASKDITKANQPISSGLPSTQINQSSVNNPNILNNTQNLNNLNQLQLVDLISSTISNTNNIDKNKVTQSINDFIQTTKTKGGNIIDSLKKIAGVIVKDPSGSTANKIISLTKTK